MVEVVRAKININFSFIFKTWKRNNGSPLSAAFRDAIFFPNWNGWKKAIEITIEHTFIPN